MVIGLCLLLLRSVYAVSIDPNDWNTHNLEIVCNA